MTLRAFWKREAYVALHAQSVRFRIVKYILLLISASFLHTVGGWPLVGWTFICLFVVAIAIHFLFRWKTKAWTRSWGPYKKLDLPT